jgi:hypothetical protein
MSKFLLNLHLQISKASVYSKIKIVIQKIIFPHFRPNRPSGQPAHPAFPPRRSPFFFFSTGHRPPLSPLGLGLSVSPARPLSPADRALVVPCLIATSLTGKHLTSRHLRPSPCQADRWAPPVITFLWRRPRSTPRRRLIEPPWLPRPPPPPSLYGRPL